ncbi:SDR family NAD(P)-dependent oxidoreductase [Parahaliea aestuarii]|nr:SDR family NAD(P)-dependent oxidoreductase [Parahaliea aestuarii]
MKIKQFLQLMNFYARFSPSYTKIGYFSRSVLWGPRKRDDFTGQVWLVTGANAGIGRSIMETAASNGARVIAVARSEEKLRDAIASLPPQVAGKVEPAIADMSLKSETHALVDKLAGAGITLDVIVNNVGVMLGSLTLTKEGLETSFATNLLSHYILTEGCLSAGLVNQGATIINMASGGLYKWPLMLDGLNIDDPALYNGKMAYGCAKRAQITLTNHWNLHHKDCDIRCYTMHPGWTRTPGVDSALPGLVRYQGKILRTPAQGADTAIWLCANRPPIAEGGEDVLWFDRKARSAHMFDATRSSRNSEAEVISYLQSMASK